eukprot:9183250-Pyramimonas_sp.AAC.1
MSVSKQRSRLRAARIRLKSMQVVQVVCQGRFQPDIATNPELGGQLGVTCEKEENTEEDVYGGHYVGSRGVRSTL